MTDLFSSHVDCQVATALVRDALGSDDYSIGTAYPNFAYVSGDRCVVMHHGHFTEPMYRAVSALLENLTGEPQSIDIDEIERVNGPWIDFVWSSFGDQGSEVAAGMFNLYEAMLDAAATHDLVKKAAELLFDRVRGVAPVSPSTKLGTHGFSVTAGALVEALLDLAGGRAAQNERMTHGTVLSPTGIDGVRWYLEGPVRGQLDAARREGTTHVRPACEHSFIFGHTQEPFQDQVLVAGYDSAVQLSNTGGWVLDHPTLSPVQGASALLVDDDARVASLRLFNDPPNDDPGVPRALGCGDPQDRDNPLLAAREVALQARPRMSDSFSTACLAGIRQRARTLRGMFFDPSADPVIDLRDPPRRPTSMPTKEVVL